jgi:nucleoside-diphosphate-sugar epimerase
VRAFVTGATGFTGGHLARTLAADGVAVRALVRERSLESAAARELRELGIETAAGDLTDAAAVGRALEGCDVAYHIAATYREAGQPDSAYRAINVGGTRHVLEGAKRAGVRRVVHCSTGGVHGHIEHPPANEDAPFAPGDIYQETKLEAEQLARRVGLEQGLEVSVVRPIGIYGPRDLRFLKMFRGIARGRFPILGGGRVFYHLTFVTDLVRGFRLAADTPAAAGHTYIIGGPEYTTLNELAERIAAVLGVRPPWIRLPAWPFWLAGAACEAVCVPLRVEPPLYRRRVDFYTKSRAFDTTRARTDLGYEPQVRLDDGLRITAEWYRQQGLL